ncbi:MAG: glutaconate CoA-transferase [Syntrophales bacterium]|nr:glutaconate CoA-transferase [Syntrophales bacterium]
MSKPYTLQELLIITAAREIHDYEKVILGVGLPTTAGALAKALYAPHAILMMESGIIDFKPLVPLNHIADVHAIRGFKYATDLFSMFTMTYRGFVDVCFLGVAQVDRFGNVNTTCIGDYYHPVKRLPGAGGAPDFISYAKRTVLTMLGGEFVERLDYFTSPGYLTGGSTRDDTGWYPQGTGPKTIITTQGVFGFDEKTKEVYLAQIHPRVRLEDIKKRVPWELKISPDLKETVPPSAEEIDFIRRFAPAQAIGRKLAMELVIKNSLKGGKDTSSKN